MAAVITEQDALGFRIIHTSELIRLFQVHIQDRPEHAEYYQSVIQHLEVIRDYYLKMMECEDVLH